MELNGLTGVRIIPTHKGKCLFHLRDNKPDISHPNKWSFVSGSIEEGELPEDAMRRECLEEIGVIPAGLKYLGRSKVSACFSAHLTDEEVEKLVLGEGQEIRFFAPEEMQNLSMAPKLEELVTTYQKSLKKLAEGENVRPEDLGLER